MFKLAKILPPLFCVAGLVFAGTATASGSASFSIALHPAKAKKNSTVTINATNFPTETSQPTSAEFQVQRGFKTNLRSVTGLCNPSATTCPSSSKIGHGSAQVTGVFLGQTIPDTVSFTLYLGKPKQAGDIGSVVVTGSDTFLHAAATGSGRLFRNSATGGLELLFDQFPTVQGLPSGIPITINSITLSAGAKRTVTRHHKRITYSLITNPSTCNGHWTGRGSVTFADGTVVQQNVSTACSR